jgi:hypothetical protein
VRALSAHEEDFRGSYTEANGTNPDGEYPTPCAKLAARTATFAMNSPEGCVGWHTPPPGVDRPALRTVAALLQAQTSAIVTLKSSGIDRPQLLDGKVADPLLPLQLDPCNGGGTNVRQLGFEALERLRLEAGSCREGFFAVGNSGYRASTYCSEVTDEVAVRQPSCAQHWDRPPTEHTRRAAGVRVVRGALRGAYRAADAEERRRHGGVHGTGAADAGYLEHAAHRQGGRHVVRIVANRSVRIWHGATENGLERWRNPKLYM